ncbi:MAG: hypothetical protein ACTSUT_00145 [Promethearchaeota archaeon]
MLSNKQITEFQILYQRHFGKEISREEAYDKAIKLVNLIKVVCCPNNQQH